MDSTRSPISPERSGEGGAVDERSRPYGDPRWPISFSSGAGALARVAWSKDVDPRFFEDSKAIYFDSKLAAFELARHYRAALGLPVVTIFPGTVVGKGDVHDGISKLINRTWSGKMPFTFEGGSSFVAANDFAEGSLLALSRGMPGETYVIAGNEDANLKYAEFQKLVMAASGRERVAM